MLKIVSLESSLDFASNDDLIFEIKSIFEQIFKKIMLFNFGYFFKWLHQAHYSINSFIIDITENYIELFYKLCFLTHLYSLLTE